MISTIHAPAGDELLAACERATLEHPVDKALTILSPFTDASRQELAALSIGRRDELMLLIRRRYFGDRLDAYCACERCGELNEFQIDVRELPSQPGFESATVRFETTEGVREARLPNSFDLAAIATLEDSDEALRTLAQRCLVGEGHELDDRAIELMGEGMAQAETLTALDITFPCSQCGAANTAPFDIATFLWNDVTDASRNLVVDVNALASAYGWSEAEILALPPRRRAMYLRLRGRG